MKVESAMTAATENATVVKKPKTFCTLTSVECMLGERLCGVVEGERKSKMRRNVESFLTRLLELGRSALRWFALEARLGNVVRSRSVLHGLPTSKA